MNASPPRRRSASREREIKASGTHFSVQSVTKQPWRKESRLIGLAAIVCGTEEGVMASQ